MAMVRSVIQRLVFLGLTTSLLCRKLSAGITQEEREEAVHRLAVYEKWCSEHVLRVGTHNTVILIPIENISPRYRDEPPGYISTEETLACR